MARIEVTRVLITGMSGTGKSTVVRELNARGYSAFDLDTPEWSEWVEATPSDDLTPAVGKDWVWQEERVRELLSRATSGVLFVSGCATNQHRLYPWIDRVVLLSAPTETIMERLKERSRDAYGSSSGERDKVARLIATVEPLLRRVADHEIDSSRSIQATTDAILRMNGLR